ncbi:MAG: hypothetical protein [Namikivirus usui]|uniref:DUF1828 domain-containing protein n=1 Tax=Bacteriophage sp. TaxID=38018 RepID=A0ABY5TSV1_9VIRU|nr:MAG: hypothetical protein [Bacteriophage sp.]
MSLDTERFTTELSDALTATRGKYTIKATHLDDYGTSYELTRHGSNRKLHLTSIEDGLIDMILYDETGTTIANGTLFDKAVADITPEDLAKLVAICL